MHLSVFSTKEGEGSAGQQGNLTSWKSPTLGFLTSIKMPWGFWHIEIWHGFTAREWGFNLLSQPRSGNFDMARKKKSNSPVMPALPHLTWWKTLIGALSPRHLETKDHAIQNQFHSEIILCSLAHHHLVKTFFKCFCNMLLGIINKVMTRHSNTTSAFLHGVHVSLSHRIDCVVLSCV